MKEQSLEQWEKEINSYSDETLIKEFRWYRRMDSGFCPISYEWRIFGLIIREIQKRNLSKKANELIDFYFDRLSEEDNEICSSCKQCRNKKNKAKWRFSCDGREVVLCEECLNHDSRTDGWGMWVEDVPQKE